MHSVFSQNYHKARKCKMRKLSFSPLLMHTILVTSLTVWQRCSDERQEVWLFMIYSDWPAWLIKWRGSEVKLLWVVVQMAQNDNNYHLVFHLFCGQMMETFLTSITFHKAHIEFKLMWGIILHVTLSGHKVLRLNTASVFIREGDSGWHKDFKRWI